MYLGPLCHFCIVTCLNVLSGPCKDTFQSLQLTAPLAFAVDEHGLPMIHAENDDSESDEEGWVMYQGASQQPASVPKRRKAQRPGKGTGAFASADDYLVKIDQDWAATPADDDLEAAPEEERPKGSKRKPKHQGNARQKK